MSRSEQQVSDHKRRSKASVTPGGLKSESDELYAVMLKAHLEDQDHQYVRDIKAFPEPSVFLATDQQLHDVVSFCTNSFEHCVLTVDPTFNLGDFDVTPAAYRHLLVECKRTGHSPVMLGPTLIHYRKTFASYLFFASSMIGRCKQIERLRVFGTDGEKPLIEAFSLEFPFALHLTCFIHVRRNVKEELNKSSLPLDKQTVILDDILILAKKLELFFVRV